MKYKNALCILAHVYLINITYGTHMGQEKSKEGTELNEHATELVEDAVNLSEEEVEFRSDDVDQRFILKPGETDLSLNDYPFNVDELKEYADNPQHEENEEENTDVENDIDHQISPPSDSGINDEAAYSYHSKEINSSCWMSLNAQSLFSTMNDIDDRYADVRKSIQEDITDTKFNEKMLETMLLTRGAAIRELYKAEDQRRLIPAGLNLGGYCMMRMPESILFFHRMKLRNDTRFRINYMENDLANMVLTARLSLNDLHLRGSYERSVTDLTPNVLFYAPSYGQVDLLLKNVEYKMEGRYRLIRERLVIEVLISEVIVTDILMTYINSALENPSTKIDKASIEEFIDRLKTDLDKWLKDYFNDFLMYTSLRGLKQLDQLEKYDKEKAIALNEYMDNAMDLIRKRLYDLNANTIRVPKFTIIGINGFQIDLHNGVLRGLESIHRRSVATTKKENDIRKVDAIVGFSNLKVSYQYNVILPTGLPPVTGMLVLSANELSAHLSLTMVLSPESVDIDIDLLDQTKPESLTVEGAATTMISNFKHLLEHQIIAIMSNTLIHGIKTLRFLPKCEPFLPGQIYLKNTNGEYVENTDLKPSGHHAETNVENKDLKKNSGFKKISKHSEMIKKSMKKKFRHGR